MKTQDKKEIREIFNEGVTKLVLPVLDKILEQQGDMIKTQEEHGEILEDVDIRLNRVELKLDNSIKRLDNHDIRISRLEKIHK